MLLLETSQRGSQRAALSARDGEVLLERNSVPLQLLSDGEPGNLSYSYSYKHIAQEVTKFRIQFQDHEQPEELRYINYVTPNPCFKWTTARAPAIAGGHGSSSRVKLLQYRTFEQRGGPSWRAFMSLRCITVLFLAPSLQRIVRLRLAYDTAPCWQCNCQKNLGCPPFTWIHSYWWGTLEDSTSESLRIFNSSCSTLLDECFFVSLHHD